MKMYSRYDHPVSDGISEWGETVTQQHFGHEVNMHEIIERSKRGMPEMMVRNNTPPVFGDFSVITDYQSAYEALSVSEDAFMSLPVETRYRFNNDPAQLLSFIADAANKDEAIKLGLIAGPVEAPKGVPDENNKAVDPPK